jgi:N-carbamoylputrescine amidase
MTILKTAFVQWPENLAPDGETWRRLADAVTAAGPDVLVTNELPFGPWLAATQQVQRPQADRYVAAHVRGARALAALNVPLVISSRPIWIDGRLANEAYALHGGACVPLHRKHYFPEEPGWHERSWFARDQGGFGEITASGARVGVLLCTEVMFNEHARHYGRAQVDLIAVPRATGQSTTAWHTACAMAALVAGCYVVSSNRVGQAGASPLFGGQAFAYAPDGTLIAETTDTCPLVCIDMDLDWSRRQKHAYPCYVD